MGSESKHKVGDLLYSNSTGLGMIKIIHSGNNGGYPYVVEWFEDLAKDYITSPSYHNGQEIEYFKKDCLPIFNQGMKSVQHKIGDLFLDATGQFLGMVTGNREIRDKDVVYKTKWVGTDAKGEIPEETITRLKKLLKEKYGYEQPQSR